MIKDLPIRLRNYVVARRLPPIVSQVQSAGLTYLDTVALKDLYAQVERLEREGIPGCLIEAGCALGGSALVIASAKSRERPFYVYDVFDMIPPPSEKDEEDVRARYETIRNGEAEGIQGRKYYGYEDNLLQKVQENFRRYALPTPEHNVHLVKGLFQDTLHVSTPVALAHVDGDWYDSVMTCLERIAPHLAVGGCLVIDDYDAWSGCRNAVDAYFQDRRDRYEFVFRSRLHILKKE